MLDIIFCKRFHMQKVGFVFYETLYRNCLYLYFNVREIGAKWPDLWWKDSERFLKKKIKKRKYYFLQKMIDVRIIPSVSENIHILLPLKWIQQVWHCLEGFLGAKIAPLQHCPPRTGPGHQCRWLTVCLVGHPEG